MKSVEIFSGNNNQHDNDDDYDQDQERASLISGGHDDDETDNIQWKKNNVNQSYNFFRFALGIGLFIIATIIGLITIMTTDTSSKTNNNNDIVQQQNIDHQQPIVVVEEQEPDFMIDWNQTNVPNGFKKTIAKVSDRYIPRGLPISDEDKELLTNKWGAWTLQPPPPGHSSTSVNLPLHKYRNGDIPRTDFPKNAWQIDSNYLQQWLPESIALVERTMEAILAEYGNGKDDKPDKSFEERSFMFSVDIFEKRENTKPPYDGNKHNGGWATRTTLNTIKRRLLHSIMIQDSFIIAMGGHSAAAGHGNHFQQSYTLQVQRILEPVLARLGVYHQAHNFGMGGLGTSQNSIAAGSIYGKHNDILIWDSGMTEPDMPGKDLFVRQAVLSSEKVPLIWGEPVLRYQTVVPELGSIFVGGWGSFGAGLPWTESMEQAETLPWATRYLWCTDQANKDFCQKQEVRFEATCWVDRDDGMERPNNQQPHPGSQVKWHPGNRAHQIIGRGIAFVILNQLLIGLKEWNEQDNYAIPDDAWHVKDEYHRMREAITNVTDSECFNSLFPKRSCELVLQGRTEFTPRYNPHETSIRSIVMEGVHLEEPGPNMYDPPESRIPALDPPQGQINVLNIIENGIDFAPNRARRLAVENVIDPARRTRKLVKSKTDIPPGKGWSLNTVSAPDNCDGTWDSFCDKSWTNTCLLYGHNDHRGGLLFDSYSGWLKLNLENVTQGLIFVRIEDWAGPEVNQATKGWKCENNENCEGTEEEKGIGGRRDMVFSEGTSGEDIFTNDGNNNHHRKLRNGNRCSDYTFEFAIDGNITTWDSDAWESNRRQAQRVMHIWTFLDDPEYTANRADKNVELAMRLTGCGRESTFLLTHVYWA